MEVIRYKRKGAGFKHVVVVHPEDHWNPKGTMALVNVNLLNDYRKKLNGWPQIIETASDREAKAMWENILDQMIAAFQIIANEEMGQLNPRSDHDHARVTVGLALYAKYFEHLWD
jgi:hypothetical protein